MKIQRDFQLSLTKPFVIVLGLVVIFSFLYFFYYPNLFSNGDESQYIHQALAFSKGKTTLEYLDLATWESFNRIPSKVAPGMALLLSPFFLVGGWKALFLLPFISHLIVTLLIVLILRHEKLNPLFAVVYLFYPIAVMMSRLVISDMLNLLFITLSIYIFWTKNQRPIALLLAGLFAGLSMLIKPTNIAFFIPLFSFHIILRRTGWIYLLLGAVIGGIPALLIHGIIINDALFFLGVFKGKSLLASANYTGSFELKNLLTNLPFYILTFTLGLFGMPLVLAFYRGRLRWEIVSTTLVMLFLISLFRYGPGFSAFYKSVVLTNRYLLPVVPLIIVVAARVISDKSINIKERFKPYRKVITGIVLLLIVTLGTATFHIHHMFIKERGKLREAIYSKTTKGSIIVHDVAVTKYIFPFWGVRHNYNWMKLNEFDILNAIERKIPIYTVFLFRGDRNWHNQCTLEFLSTLESVCTLEPVTRVEIKGEILEINRIISCTEPLPTFINEDCLRRDPPRSKGWRIW